MADGHLLMGVNLPLTLMGD